MLDICIQWKSCNTTISFSGDKIPIKCIIDYRKSIRERQVVVCYFKNKLNWRETNGPKRYAHPREEHLILVNNKNLSYGQGSLIRKSLFYMACAESSFRCEFLQR